MYRLGGEMKSPALQAASSECFAHLFLLLQGSHPRHQKPIVKRDRIEYIMQLLAQLKSLQRSFKLVPLSIATRAHSRSVKLMEKIVKKTMKN